MYAPVRGGNRGGQDQFKWDDVRLMSYKDREQYLGFSEKLGYLDKGGKWRKKDWWTEGDDEGNGKPDKNEILRREREQVKREDEALMRQKLGLEPHKDTKVLLQELREGSVKGGPMGGGAVRLADYELKELMQRGDAKAFEMGATVDGVAIDEGYMADRVGGLGAHPTRPGDINKKLKFQQNAGTINMADLNKLSGECDPTEIDQQLRYVDQHKKLLLLQYLRDKLATTAATKEPEKDHDKKSKKHKKDKKKKKHHKKRRHHSSSSSESREKEEEVKDRKSHRDISRQPTE